jgi:hypothetical protein
LYQQVISSSIHLVNQVLTLLQLVQGNVILGNGTHNND